MSRSYRKVAKLPVCCVGHKGIKEWKHDTKQQRRAREKEQMNGIVEDEEGFDEETCTPIKYQKVKDMNDWAGPHDGWRTYSPKSVEHIIEQWHNPPEHLKDMEPPADEMRKIEKRRYQYFSK